MFQGLFSIIEGNRKEIEASKKQLKSISTVAKNVENDTTKSPSSTYQFKEPATATNVDDKSCPICYRMFSLKSSLQNHIPIHDAHPRFHCTNCGKKFFQFPNLCGHKRQCKG